ncbi:hypothetical protein SEA_ANNADREAMY_144 [Streptomyces phage Annadreamy]|uniref:Uncharacterized protein n=1 Tax=Streptomyces phage Annadreamy TaxID=2250335 RepID=A0A345GTG6_9CAUD|nr:hypothetical protein HWB75_gp125 [Streptomyces phage Annadreamy]AXG66238.1 hypothetical protein SEA_ANNADREAMY_144 [Streptomyces phage Annadreamy]
MANDSGIPKPAKYAVKCDKSSSGKHTPTTRETKVDGQHIKYKICTSCNGTLK